MSGLDILLLTSCEKDFSFIQYFPESYDRSNKINELIMVSQYFKNCGKGCLLNKDRIYYYRTFFPNIEEEINRSNPKIFILFYCNLRYKEKYIDEFNENIIDLLEKSIFEENKLDQEIVITISELFDIYKDLNGKEEIYHEYINNIMNKAMNNLNNNSSHNNSMISIDKSICRKRMDSRIRRDNSLITIKKEYNFDKIENIEMVKINEGDTDLTLILKRDKNNSSYIKIKTNKKIKIINVIIFTILGIVSYILLPLVLNSN